MNDPEQTQRMRRHDHNAFLLMAAIHALTACDDAGLLYFVADIRPELRARRLHERSAASSASREK